ncbi:phage tailspike protein [Enterobacter hormaechei]|uniref:phage tailspike protein n=1 Tax=Enterobacter hormaechei TaxID=158836 RepID=UPI00298B1DBE|nr:phage tail protein [Enterobacter hormaechei]HBL6016950.1 phage tail protein [Enterobacter hormaechei]HBL6131258.1 phage tail protein [Enterobacter hormaechei]HBL8998211.1 phage tail protein [Enterobacter hormaechei]HBL9016463.1 phage tail protein [Enterobacter hormaechei]
MSDITANVVVTNPRPIFTDSRTFRAVANGRIYIGLIDTDPTIPTNQIPVYIENEDGSHVQIPQPLIVNTAGKIVYSGQLVKVVTVQGHSMAIYDAYGSQVDYIANVLKYDPDRLRQDLQSDTLTGLVNDHVVYVKQPYDGSVTITQHDKNAEFISVTDFGAVGDGVTDDTSAFQKAINAAYRSGGKGAYVYIPPKDNYYKVSNLQITSAITLFSAGKYGATLKTDVGNTVVVKARFTEIVGINFIGGGKNAGNSSGVVINEALIKMADCSFAFYDVCYYAPEKKSSAELCVQNNRFASSQYGVFLGGGQINSHFFNNTYSDCNTMIHVSEILTDGVQSTTEGLVFTQELGYDCGNDTLGMKAVEVVGTRWTWFDHCMVDLSHDVALSLTDAKDVKVTGGYYSSNNSTTSPCLLIEGASWNFLAQGTCFSDSRSYGVSVTKKSTDIPKNCRFIGVTFQNNDIDPAQSGDIIINSVPDVSLNNCNLLSNKTGSVSVIDNLSGGSSVYLDGCSITGGAFVASGCKLKNINSPTHPESQFGILTIPGGGNTVSTPLTIRPLQSGVAIAVLATPASGGDVISAGVQGSNIVINRPSSPVGSTVVSFSAFTVS